MTDAWLEEISLRYIELFEQVTGKPFVRQDYSNADARMENAVLAFLDSYKGA